MSMSIFFVIVTMIFVAIAFLLPEWMGITGKKARKIIEAQRDTSLDHLDKKEDESAQKDSQNESSASDKN